jgi:hypothetical protein
LSVMVMVMVMVMMVMVIWYVRAGKFRGQF